MAILKPKGEDRVRGGHPWVYRSDIADVRDPEPGAIVEVRGPRNRMLGHALFSDQSQITIRMISRARSDRRSTRRSGARGSRRAIRFRDSLQINATAFRLVHGEADLLPSLIVDRYGDYLVMQTLSQGMDRLAPELVKLLVEITGAKGILARNDPKVRTLEGLEQKVEVLLRRGARDDRRRRKPASPTRSIRGAGRRPACFSISARTARPPRVTRTASCSTASAITADSPSPSPRTANPSKRLTCRPTRWSASPPTPRANGITNLSAREANVFDELRHLERDGARYDTIVLDPPAFAKNKASIPNALAGYKEINLRALRLLNPGGYLITCSCSYNVDEGMFAAAVFDASADAHIPVTVVEKRMQGRDHPVLLGVPETYYLKSFILRKLA